MEKVQKRQVAYKIRINDVLKGGYVKEEGEWVPNYIKIGDKKVSRVNLLAVVVSKQGFENASYQNIGIDDGSGRVSVRSFDASSNFDKIEIGDVVAVIGRPREYLNEKYIVSEILKKIENPLWIEVRKLELMGRKETAEENKPEELQKEMNGGGVVDDINTKIFSLIRGIDDGEGADIQEVITKSNLQGAEGIIERLLKNGEIFEIRSGKLKVLE